MLQEQLSYMIYCTNQSDNIDGKVAKTAPGEDKELIKKAKVVADKVFLLAMKDAQPKVSGWKIYSAWKAVDLFGRWSIIPNEDNI